ncbi:MAG TPA: hypothetical protein VFQ61_26725 [Polyangiaceae bacterium]|nr:hypothetical protein [Polyangiaceae bacterium]
MRKLSSSSQIFAPAFLTYLITAGVVRAEPIAPVLSPSSGLAPTSESQTRPGASDMPEPPSSPTNPPPANPAPPPTLPAAQSNVETGTTPSAPDSAPQFGAPTPTMPKTNEGSRANGNSSTSAGVALRMQVNYAGSWLEARSFDENWAGSSGFRRLCFAPCRDVRVSAEQEIRVLAPGMTPSPVFRLQPGSGAALLTVRGGSQWLRTLGRVGLVVGLPVAGLGMAGLGYGAFEDQAGLRNAGAVTLGVGGVLILAALPLLVLGSTSVLNDRGERVATAFDTAKRW